MMRRLIGDVLVLGDPAATVIPNGAVDVDDDGRIAAVGPISELGPSTESMREVRIGGLLMPGLVNAHAHGPMTLVRSAGDGLPLMQWLTEAIWPREGRMTPDDVHLGMQLASCEMLLAGVTTSTEMYLFEGQVAAAVEEVGGRTQVMAGVISAIAPDEASFAARLNVISEFCESQAQRSSSPLVTAGFGPHSVYDLGPDRLEQVAAAATAVNAPIHIHLEETKAERAQIFEAHGRSATQLLAEAGVLERPVVGAHGVWLDADDLKLLAAASAVLVHCPVSNLKLGSGIADIASWRRAGVTIALGTDGVASNDNLNMWEDLRIAPLLSRGSSLDPEALSAPQALALATSGGAAATGIDDIGELRPGAWADIIRLDIDDPAFATGVNGDRLANLVWAASARHVTDVWVAGNQVVADRTVTTVDLPEIQRRALEASQRLASG